MSAISLLYQTDLPSYNDRTFEASIGNWTDEGNHVLSRTTAAGEFRTGIAAAKIIASGAGSYAANYIELGAACMPPVILGLTYRVRLYAKASAGTPSLIIANAGHTGGQTIDELNSSTWTKCEFDFTAVAADVSSHIIRIWTGSAATIYIDDVQIFRIETFSNPLAISGIDDPDSIEFFPSELLQLPNGNYFRREPKVFNRNIMVKLGVLQTKSKRVFLAEFAFKAKYTALIYGSEEIEVVPRDPKQFQNEWLDDCSLEKYYVLDFIEKNGQTTNPTSWNS